MSFSKDRTWDNRISGKLLIHGKTWTRRITQLSDGDGNVKLKMEICPIVTGANEYKEVLVPSGLTQTVWDRFKTGQSIEDCVSILGKEVPKPMRSRKAADSIYKSPQDHDMVD